jgi:hypothetical protein
MGIFDKRITSFNQIKCEFSVISSRFISDFAKKVKINLENLKDKDQSKILESNDQSVTDELIIQSSTLV